MVSNGLFLPSLMQFRSVGPAPALSSSLYRLRRDSHAGHRPDEVAPTISLGDGQAFKLLRDALGTGRKQPSRAMAKSAL